MCVLCIQLWVEEHWAEASDDAGEGSDVVALETHARQRGQRLRDRAERSRLFARILRPFGLTLQDWEGSSYILRDAKGVAAVVPNLALVWQEVERMLGYPLDPLDPELLDTLARRSAMSRQS
jgi:hypothetical protein